MEVDAEMKDTQKALQMAAYLLQYPDQDWRQELPEWEKAVTELERPQFQEVFADFFAYIAAMEPREYEDQYVRIFDFSKNTTLYLTSHDCTDPGKQAAELLAYKAFFSANGFGLFKELPDYLPALLELCAAVPEDEAGHILQYARHKIELLRERLIEGKLVYAFLLDVVLTAAGGLEGKTA